MSVVVLLVGDVPKLADFTSDGNDELADFFAPRPVIVFQCLAELPE